jgi:hypothetical protein
VKRTVAGSRRDSMGLSDQEESEERCGLLTGTKEGSSGSSGSRTSRDTSSK